MELLRVRRDVYGREVLEGISWDLIGVFFSLGLAIIVLHLVYRQWFAPAEAASAAAEPVSSSDETA